jgi:hypothetical protein
MIEYKRDMFKGHETGIEIEGRSAWVIHPDPTNSNRWARQFGPFPIADIPTSPKALYGPRASASLIFAATKTLSYQVPDEFRRLVETLKGETDLLE